MPTQIGPYMTAEDYGAEYGVFDRHNKLLGSVRWYPRWRKHVLDTARTTKAS